MNFFWRWSRPKQEFTDIENDLYSKPLPLQFFSELLRLEEKYFSGILSLEIINELIQLYAVFIY